MGKGRRVDELFSVKSHEIVYVAERIQQTFPKGAGMK
jgi:hypothetical protein